jgi:hypothetical protein
MPNFKTCKNGHNYDAAQYSECPFCPANTQGTDYEKTMTDFKKTQVFDDGNSSQFDKTMINEETLDMKTTPVGNASSQHPFSRTTILMDDNTSNLTSLQQTEKRKLVGWLVTFSHDEYGQDYKLYVGKNIIGSAAGSDVVIMDTSVSGDHATILFRENEFLIKDNFSTNGSKINGATVAEGKLKDGDEIRFGNTAFKFRTAF